MCSQRARLGKSHGIREFRDRLIGWRSRRQISGHDFETRSEERVLLDRSPGDKSGFRSRTKHHFDPLEPSLNIREEHCTEMASCGIEAFRRKWQLCGAGLHDVKVGQPERFGIFLKRLNKGRRWIGRG